MEAINYIKKYHKEYLGYIDYNYYDNDNRNYLFYKLLYCENPINEYIYKEVDKNIKKINIYTLIKKFNLDLKKNKSLNILIPKEFKKVEKIIYNDNWTFDIKNIYIENIETLDYINISTNLILLNGNMQLKYVKCTNIICKNCSFNELHLTKGELITPNRINKLIINRYCKVLIDNKDCIINNLIIKNSKDNIIIKNCQCNNIKLTFNKYNNLIDISNINLKEIFINCYDINLLDMKMFLNMFNNKIIKNIINDNEINKEKYKYIKIKTYYNKIIKIYIGEEEVFIIQ